MSETRIPQGTLPPGQSPRILSSAETAVKLITVPTEVKARLKAEHVVIRLQGEVVRKNDDGSIRVRTQSGDVDVRLREGQQPPVRGQRVEIEIQPPRDQRPPETASLRELPRQNEERTDNAPAPQTPQRGGDTPVDIEVREDRPSPDPQQPRPAEVRHPQQAAQEAQNPLPPEGTAVRLQPLPARAAQALAYPDFTETITATLPALAGFKASVIVEDVLAQIGKAVIDIPVSKPPPPAHVLNAQIPAYVTPSAPSPALPVVLTSNFPAGPTITALPPDAPEAPPLSAQIPAQTSVRSAFIPAGSVTAVPPADTALFIPAIAQRPALNILQAVRQNVLNPLQQAAHLIAPKAQALDVTIEHIAPPHVQVVPPGKEGAHASLNHILKNQIEALQKQPENLILQNQKAANLNGIVTAVTPEKLPVLNVFFPQTGSEQVFALQFPVDAITTGTQIQVTPQPGTPPSFPTATLPQVLPLPVYLQPQPWPAMEEVLQTLVQSAPQAAQAMVNVTPSPANPAQLGPAMMFFIAAVRGGDLTQWLGKSATDALRTERGGNALSRLLGEAPTLTRISSEHMPQDWRALSIPLYWQGDMHKVAVYYKHDGESGEEAESGARSTRFVFDLALDKMGKVQLDGLFRPVSKEGTRLDVVVRTEEHFSQATQAEMRRVYAKALRDTQITGELSFQGQTGWVTIQANEQNKIGVSA